MECRASSQKLSIEDCNKMKRGTNLADWPARAAIVRKLAAESEE